MEKQARPGVPGEVTLLLHRASAGDAEAAGEAVRLVYHELRRIAGAYMGQERSGHTLQPTALIHEAWLRMANQSRVEWRDRKHFFGVAAEAMRRALVDHARARLAEKRGSGAEAAPLEWVEIDTAPAKLEEVLAVDEALERLRKFDALQARIVELHYFAGMTVRETAEALEVSPRTVDREWAMAAAWLRRELSKGARG